MALARVQHRTDTNEHFGPVRLGPQDLRDVAAIFDDLTSKVPPGLPGVRTKFVLPEHETEDIEDVLRFANADTLSSIHILDGEVRLGFHAGRDGTLISKHHHARGLAERQAVEGAAEQLRQIIRSRQLKPLAALKQRGPGKGLMIALLAAPALLLAGGQALLELWLTTAWSTAVGAGLVWLSVLPLLVLVAGRPKDLIRLRGQQEPWAERRQGLVTLVGVVLGLVIPFVVLGLESRRK